MARVNISGNYKESGLTKAKVEETVKAVFDFLEKEKTVNIAFVTDEEIQELNKKYIHKDKATDVLSFNYEEEGDIALSLNLISKLKEDSESLAEAVQKTIIHGTLHLFGCDHEKEKDRAIMTKKEEDIFNKLKES